MKFLISLLLACFTTVAVAQQDSMLPAYKRYPTLPPLQLLLGDSTTKYTKDDIPKKTPVLLVLFNPDCEHCQHEAEQIVAHKDGFQKMHIIMATTASITKMKKFATQYGLSQMQNVVVARDLYYFLPSFYMIHNMPYLALYDKKGKLIDTFEGSVGIEKVLETFNQKK